MISKRKSVFLCIVGGLIGAIPGTLIFFVGAIRPGVSVGLFGAFIGAMFALPGVSVARVFRMLAAWFVAKNVPFVSERIMEWGASPDEMPDDDAFTGFSVLDWMEADHVQRRRGWMVLLGLALGLVIGVYRAVTAAPDHDIIWSVVKVAVCGLWSAAVAGLFASSAYRRPLLCAALPAAAWGALIGWTAQGGDTSAVLWWVGASTTIALILAFIIAAPQE